MSFESFSDGLLVTTGSAEEILVPAYADLSVESAGRALPAAACNVDGEYAEAGWGREVRFEPGLPSRVVSSSADLGCTLWSKSQDWEEDWEEDSAARQAAAVACDDDGPRSTPKRQKKPKRAPPQRRLTEHAAAAAAADQAHQAQQAHQAAAREEPRPAHTGAFCVLETVRFLGAQPGHEFKLGNGGKLGYYPTPDRLLTLRESVQQRRPQGRWPAKPTGTYREPDGAPEALSQ